MDKTRSRSQSSGDQGVTVTGVEEVSESLVVLTDSHVGEQADRILPPVGTPPPHSP